MRAKVVGWLFTHPDERFFVRQLGSLIGEDATNLSRELARLRRLGILTCKREGRQMYYQANRACPVFPELQGLAVKTFGLVDVLRELLGPLGGKIDVALIYGSQATGRFSAASDVDLMVVGEVGFGQVVSALRPAHDRLGREVNPTVYPRAEFREKLAAGHHFLTDVLAGPKVFVIGDQRELEELVEERLGRGA